MIELTHSQLRVATAIRDGASTIEEICAAVGIGPERAKRVLLQIGDVLGIERVSTHRDCDRPAVVSAVRAAEGFTTRPVVTGISHNVLGRESATLRAPAEWPAYCGGVHDLGSFL